MFLGFNVLWWSKRVKLVFENKKCCDLSLVIYVVFVGYLVSEWGGVCS